MALQIPRENIAGIVELAKLSDALIKQLTSALNAAPKFSDSDDMAAHIAKEVASVSIVQATMILDSLYGLYHVREFASVEPTEFLNDVIEATSESSFIEPKLKDQELALLKSRLSDLL